MMFILSPSNDHQHSQGICVTCQLAENCGIRQRALFAIWSCDQHLDEDESEEAQPLHIEEYKEEENKIPGLCMNCEHRNGCSLRGEGKVIFHCEEYL